MLNEEVRAVADARYPQPMTPLEAIREELESLWSDLGHAVRDAINGRWSMQCDNVARRIVVLTDIVGPLKWTQCPPDLLRDGADSMFAQLNATMGHPLPLTDIHDMEGWLESQYASRV
jgi:hypothetical protein